jgi:two-component system sensor histidine kinase ChvG
MESSTPARHIPSIEISENETLAPRPLSRLTYKIMSLNVISIVVLFMGASYLDQYRKDLTSAETEILSVETMLYASVLSQTVREANTLDIKSTRELAETFARQKPQNIKLLDEKGSLIYDSDPHYFSAEALSQKDSSSQKNIALSLIEKGFSFIVNIVSVDFRLPDYPAPISMEGWKNFPDVRDALKSESTLSAWRNRSGGLILSSAVPILRDGDVVGVILITRSDTRIETLFSTTQLDVIRLVLISLIFTISLSLYLAAIIGHPLRKLALAAEKLRLSKGKFTEIPDMSERQDEIGELSHSLRAMTEFLQHRLNATERFAADVAHELKNPLTSMRSATETLTRIDNEEDREKLTAVILHDLQRMDRLITDISQASRLDAELSRDIFSQIDLRDILLPIVDIWQKPLERGQTEATPASSIKLNGLDHPILVNGHPGRLAQVFQNLIGNALSFSPKNKPVNVTVESNADRVKIVIDDEGPGIPENRLEKIFERFYSERPTGESFGSHSGLGLSISRQIVTAYGGTIHAENRYDENGKIEGARFIVRLKAAHND